MSFDKLASGSSTTVPSLYDSPAGQMFLLDLKEKKATNPFVVNTGDLLVRQGRWATTKGVTSSLRELIAFEFSLVRDVQYVFTAFRENHVFYAWVVVDRFEEDVRNQIYNRQEAVIDEFPELEFDFYIISRMGRDIGDLIDTSAQLTYQKASM